MSRSAGAGGSPGQAGDHEQLRILLGGHLLGGATTDDEARLAVHLRTCGSCRAELDELDGVVDLLTLPVPDHGVPPLPEALKRRVLVAGAVDQRPRRQPVRRFVAPAAAALALLLGLAVGSGAGPFGRGPAAGEVVVVQLAAVRSGATGQALLRAEDAVISVDLDVTGLEVPAGRQTYELWLVHDEGRVSAGTFRPGPGGDVDLDLAAAGPITRYNRVGITLEPDDHDPSRNGDTVIAGTLTP